MKDEVFYNSDGEYEGMSEEEDEPDGCTCSGQYCEPAQIAYSGILDDVPPYGYGEEDEPYGCTCGGQYCDATEDVPDEDVPSVVGFDSAERLLDFQPNVHENDETDGSYSDETDGSYSDETDGSYSDETDRSYSDETGGSYNDETDGFPRYETRASGSNSSLRQRYRRDIRELSSLLNPGSMSDPSDEDFGDQLGRLQLN